MDSPTTPWSIYLLRDPDTNAIRYVGKAEKPSRRLVKHLSEAARNSLWSARWICTLLAVGKRPIMDVVEQGIGESWKEAECRWIKKCREEGADLTNLAEGGNGGSGPLSDEARRKISAALAGRPHSPEHVAKVAAAKTGQPRPEASKKAQRQKLLGRKYSSEHRAAISNGLQGRKQSAQHLAALSAVRKGRKHTAETKRQMSASRTGKKQSKETRAKRSASLKAWAAKRKAEQALAADATPPSASPARRARKKAA